MIEPSLTQLKISDATLPPAVDLGTIGESLILVAEVMPVHLIPLKSSESPESLRALFPDGPLCICDFYVDGAENWEPVVGGFYHNYYDILNIDHHAEHPDMYSFISSGNLAIDYVKEYGPSLRIQVNNHTDCDSVISRLIMGGELPPLPYFGEAVIAADHTGLVHPVADLLQALDAVRDLRFSTRNLGLLLSGKPLDPQAQALVDKRLFDREQTIAFVEQGRYELHGKLAYLELDGKMRNEFLPALLPEVALFLTSEPGGKVTEGRPVTRLRIGHGAPDGFTIFDLDMDQIDPHYGGRWNAGANKRGGGCRIAIDRYVKRLADKLKSLGI